MVRLDLKASQLSDVVRVYSFYACMKSYTRVFWEQTYVLSNTQMDIYVHLRSILETAAVRLTSPRINCLSTVNGAVTLQVQVNIRLSKDSCSQVRPP